MKHLEKNGNEVREDEFLGTKELLERIHVSDRTLSSWRKDGKIPYICMGGKPLYYWPEVKEALLSVGHGKKPSEKWSSVCRKTLEERRAWMKSEVEKIWKREEAKDDSVKSDDGVGGGAPELGNEDEAPRNDASVCAEESIHTGLVSGGEGKGDQQTGAVLHVPVLIPEGSR